MTGAVQSKAMHVHAHVCKGSCAEPGRGQQCACAHVSLPPPPPAVGGGRSSGLCHRGRAPAAVPLRGSGGEQGGGTVPPHAWLGDTISRKATTSRAEPPPRTQRPFRLVRSPPLPPSMPAPCSRDAGRRPAIGPSAERAGSTRSLPRRHCDWGRRRARTNHGRGRGSTDRWTESVDRWKQGGAPSVIGSAPSRSAPPQCQVCAGLAPGAGLSGGSPCKRQYSLP